MSFGTDLQQLLQPMFYDDALHGNALSIFLQGLGDAFQVVEDYASDTDEDNPKPGYSLWLDLDRVPDEVLPYLAQYVGIQVTTGLTPDQIKEQIAALGAWGRGTLTAFKTAPKYLLRGAGTVQVTERDTSPYHMLVTVTKADLPLVDIPTTNLWTNGGIETNTTGWQIHGSAGPTFTRVTDSSMFGAASLLCAFNATGGARFGNASLLAVTAGLPYSLSAYVRTKVGARPIDIRCQFLDSGSATVGTFQSVGIVPPTTDYIRIKLENMVVPPTAINAYWDIGTSVSGGAGDAWWMDGVQFEQQAEALPYVDTNGATNSTLGQGLVFKALLAAKPAGLVMNFVINSGQGPFTMRQSSVRGLVPDAIRL